jgi:16S rRNA (cytosine967-C5)-methyltransferase
VQDIASQYCVKALDPQRSERILDLCAAPGGKSIGAAIAMQDTGEIRSFDLFAHKVRLIEENAARMGLTSIHAAIGDAAVYNENLGLFDRVLCDVPCSGLGVIRRKPEIRNKPEAEVKALPALQLRILENAARYLKAGGILIYSTCTINRLENEDVCKRFLEAHKDFTVLQTDLPGMRDDCGVTLHPVQNDSDGFYIAKLQKK